MLLWLADLLGNWFTGFNLFQYTTFRAVMAALTALLFGLLLALGPYAN